MTEYTPDGINQALAAAILAAIPGVHIYDNPNQQGTKLPAVFISYRGDQPIQRQIGGRWMQTLKFDLSYMVELNLPDTGDQYRTAAAALDDTLDTLVMADGSTLLTTKRSWHTDLDALHYQLDLPVRLKRPYTPAPMRTMTLEEKINEQ